MDQTSDAPITRSSQRLLAITNGLSLRSGRALESRDDDNPRMRIGADFQAVLPDLQESGKDEGHEERPKPLLLWKPSEAVSDEDIDGFVKVAHDHFNFSNEQALGILFWFNYDISKALAELKNYSPFEDEWTVEDKVIFEQAYQKYGKNFQRIRSMLPSKPIGNLVKYYYQWKKEHSQLSMIDKKAHMKKLWCSHVVTNGEPTPERGSTKGRRLPKDIYLSSDTFLKTADDKHQDAIKRLDKDIEELHQQIQCNKQNLSRSPICYLEKEDVELLRPASALRRSSHLALWSGQEIEAALHAIRTYGNDMSAIAGAVETKSVDQCEAFMIHYKRKYNLPTLLHNFHLKQRSRKLSEDILTEEVQLAGENRTGEQVYQPPVSSEDTTPPSKRSKFINTIV